MALEPPDPYPTTDPTLDPADPLGRALAAVRDEQPEGWVALSDSIMRRVREVVTPAYPLLVRELPDGSRTYVSTRVVAAGLRLLLSREPTHAPSGIRLHLDEDRLTGIDLALVAAYGVDLLALADRVRAEAIVEVAALTGLAPLTPVDVGVDVVDVVDGDPRVV